jgi:HSP20 family molecular chaperone IbpA
MALFLGPIEQLFADAIDGAPGLFASAERLLTGGSDEREQGVDHLIKVDIVATPAAFLVVADAPGCRKADMRVEVDDSRPQAPLLHVSVARDAYPLPTASDPVTAGAAAAAAGTTGADTAAAVAAANSQDAIVARLSPSPGDSVGFVHAELQSGRLHRTIRLPRAGLLQLDKISCRAACGVLTITLPRVQAQEADDRRMVRVA